MDIHRKFLAALAVSTLFLAGPALVAQDRPSAITLSTVVIDPGHGGKDAGCVSPSGKTMEKTIVLDIATRLAGKIKAGYPGLKVILTRDDDTFVTLQGRADIANCNNANLFISVHVNSVEGKKSAPNGYSVHILGQYTSKNKDLYAGNMDVVRRENSVIKLEDDYTTRYEGFDPSDPESYIFMNLMQNAFLEQSLVFAQKVDNAMKGGAIARSRGISQDPFYVLWRTAMPAVLVECGFMSNTGDRSVLITEDGRERIASDLYDAFRAYKKEYDGTEAVGVSAKKAEAASKTAESTGIKEETSVTTSGSKTESAAEETSGNENVSVRYGTQILVSSKQMAENDPFFGGREVLRLPAGRYFKYIIGVSADLETAKKANSGLKSSYKDSFLVKIENGVAEMVR